MEIHFSIGKTPESLQGKDIIYALFQRIGKRVIPLGETVRGGTVKQTESGNLVSTLVVKVPKLSGPSQLAVKAQIDGTTFEKVINFTALPDDILTQLAGRNIRITGDERIRKAFTDRALNIPEHSLDDLNFRGDWTGVWFVRMSGDVRGNLSMPTHLNSEQVVVLLEENNNEFPFPIAVQKGDGWLVHFNQSWFENFSTNAGTQSAFFNTINRITSK